jgi:hypothetical protein
MWLCWTLVRKRFLTVRFHGTEATHPTTVRTYFSTKDHTIHNSRHSHKSLTYKFHIVLCNLLNPQNPFPHLYFKSSYQTNQPPTHLSLKTTNQNEVPRYPPLPSPRHRKTKKRLLHRPPRRRKSLRYATSLFLPLINTI